MTIIYSECGPSSDDRDTDVSRLIAHNVPCNHNRDGTLCGICMEIAEVESEISDLHFRLEELHAKHRTLRAKRNNSSNIITKLPYDVASHIFLLCLPPIEREFCPDLEPHCTGFRTPRLPLTLSAVCLSWRRLVFAIPLLWSTLSIDIEEANIQHISHRLQFSGSVPLFVLLHAGSRREEDANLESAHSLRLIMLVKKNLHRVALLCLNFPCLVMNTFFSRDLDIPNTLPTLEEIHFHCSSESACMVPHNFVLSIDPPRPHKVFVTSSFTTNIWLDWKNVRHLSLTIEGSHSHLLIADALSILSKGKRLQVVDLLGPSSLDFDILTGVMFTQNSIRNLRLFDTHLQILLHTTMPCLESLTLRDTAWDSKNPLVSFLRRSACPLKTLDWKPIGAPPPEQAFIDVFRCTPKVQQLYLNLNDFVDWDSERQIVPFLERLCVVSSHDAELLGVQLHDRILLPLLQKFVYAGPTVHALPSLFLDIVETRSGTLPTSEGSRVPQPLEELNIYRPSFDMECRPIRPLLQRADQQRMLQLNATRKKISVLRHTFECDLVNTDFSASYYDD